MGQTIAGLMEADGRQPIWALRGNPDRATLEARFQEVDVVVEFTRPDAAPGHLLLALETGTPMVSGTTGWDGQQEAIRTACLDRGGSLFWAPNFSIGIQLFSAIHRYAAALMQRYPQYRTGLTEIHHTRKLDAPSGTAVRLAEEFIQVRSDYNRWQLADPSAVPDPGTLPVIALREGDVPGTHRMTYTGPDDALQLSHEAFGRKGFARGALMAADWLPGRQGFFGLSDMLEENP